MPNFQVTRLVLTWNPSGALLGGSAEGFLEGTSNPTQPLALSDVANNPILAGVLGELPQLAAENEQLRNQVAILQNSVATLTSEKQALLQQLQQQNQDNRWARLYGDFLDADKLLPTFQRVKLTAKTDTAVSTSLSLLISTISSTKLEPALAVAIQDLAGDLAAAGEPLTALEKSLWNASLVSYGFSDTAKLD